MEKKTVMSDVNERDVREIATQLLLELQEPLKVEGPIYRDDLCDALFQAQCQLDEFDGETASLGGEPGDHELADPEEVAWKTYREPGDLLAPPIGSPIEAETVCSLACKAMKRLNCKCPPAFSGSLSSFSRLERADPEKVAWETYQALDHLLELPIGSTIEAEMVCFPLWRAMWKLNCKCGGLSGSEGGGNGAPGDHEPAEPDSGSAADSSS